MVIAVYGNHDVSYCTESELAWSFERLGHKVIRFQENRTPTDEILRRCCAENVSLLVYVHTHTWTTVGQLSLEDLWTALRTCGIKTAGFHLDLYFGLNAGDRRDYLVGQHPFWKVDTVFTADGGHQAQFKERGVNHVWLPPGVVERGCYRGNYTPSFACDVGFVGSKDYHYEYPFRSILVSWLEQTYGPRFKRANFETAIGTLREQRLNDFYASAKVVVGDSCFAGIPYYWSDRVPETLGRGGFLVHPEVEGLAIPGLVTYKPRDFVSLRATIDYFVANDDARKAHVEQTAAHVKAHDTYTNRCNTILQVMEVL